MAICRVVLMSRLCVNSSSREPPQPPLKNANSQTDSFSPKCAVPELDHRRAQAKPRALRKKTEKRADGRATQRQHGAVAKALQNACQIHCVPQ